MKDWNCIITSMNSGKTFVRMQRIFMTKILNTIDLYNTVVYFQRLKYHSMLSWMSVLLIRKEMLFWYFRFCELTILPLTYFISLFFHTLNIIVVETFKKKKVKDIKGNIWEVHVYYCAYICIYNEFILITIQQRLLSSLLKIVWD